MKRHWRQWHRGVTIKTKCNLPFAIVLLHSTLQWWCWPLCPFWVHNPPFLLCFCLALCFEGVGPCSFWDPAWFFTKLRLPAQHIPGVHVVLHDSIWIYAVRLRHPTHPLKTFSREHPGANWITSRSEWIRDPSSTAMNNVVQKNAAFIFLKNYFPSFCCILLLIMNCNPLISESLQTVKHKFLLPETQMIGPLN